MMGGACDDVLCPLECIKVRSQIVQGVVPFTLKSMLTWQKKTYGNSNISPCKNIIFKKNP
jgi:hypothetical protein